LTFLFAAATKAVAAATKAPVKLTPEQQQELQKALQGAQQAPQQPAQQMTPTFIQAHASWLTHGLAGIFIIAAIALVALLAVQTTKQEGLSGTIGGRVESAYGRMGAEEQLKRITGFAAVVFVLTGFILSLTGI
jgi:preprotein translocase subunit SecG